MTATIDHSGALVGVGTFTFTGESAVLGISTTTLLSGEITSDGSSMGIFQFNGPVTTLDPTLQVVVGPIDSAVLDFVGVPPFTSSFTTVTEPGSPEIFLVSAAAVPEPPSALLFIGGVLAVLAFQASRAPPRNLVAGSWAKPQLDNRERCSD